MGNFNGPYNPLPSSGSAVTDSSNLSGGNVSTGSMPVLSSNMLGSLGSLPSFNTTGDLNSMMQAFGGGASTNSLTGLSPSQKSFLNLNLGTSLNSLSGLNSGGSAVSVGPGAGSGSGAPGENDSNNASGLQSTNRSNSHAVLHKLFTDDLAMIKRSVEQLQVSFCEV